MRCQIKNTSVKWSKVHQNSYRTSSKRWTSVLKLGYHLEKSTSFSSKTEAALQQGSTFSYHLDLAQGRSMSLLFRPPQCGTGAGLAAGTSWAGSWLGSLQTLPFLYENKLYREALFWFFFFNLLNIFSHSP